MSKEDCKCMVEEYKVTGISEKRKGIHRILSFSVLMICPNCKQFRVLAEYEAKKHELELLKAQREVAIMFYGN